MATNYPGSLDTSTQQPSPSASTEMDDSGFEHDVVHANHSGAIIAVETKVGTGASTPVADSVLGGTGSGTSAWTTTPTLGGLTLTGALLASDGSNSAPAYSFTNDSNTGFYVAGNDGVVRFVGNGTPGGWLSNTGIRTVDGSASTPSYSFTSDSNTGMFRSDTDELGFSTGGTQRLTIKSDGDVGIGTTSPAHPLDVVGEARFSSSVQFNNGDQVIRTWGSGAIDNLLPGSTFGGILEGNSSGHFVIGIRDNDTNDSFSVISGGGDQTTNGYDTVVAYFGADGQVGIGTSSPNKQLHVNAGTTNATAVFESTDSTAYIGVKDNSTSGDNYVAIGAVGNELRLRANNTNYFSIESAGTIKSNTEHFYAAASSKTLIAASPPTGTGNDAEWAAPLGIYILYRNSSLAAEKENISADLGTHLTADMIDQVVPKMWNRIHAPGYPEIGPIAEDMDAISPFLAARGTTAENVPFLTGINKTAYLSLLVLAVKDLRQRVVELENA